MAEMNFQTHSSVFHEFQQNIQTIATLNAQLKDALKTQEALKAENEKLKTEQNPHK